MDISKLHQLFLESAGVSTDTRSLQSGQIYVALKGQHFDGNQYAHQALESGANYAIVDDVAVIDKTDDRYLLVEDTLRCLQNLATAHRQYCQATVIGITGSNGKTTTKELLSAVLSTTYKVSATYGNLNNHIGVPLTLLSVTPDMEYSIVEMGANGPTDIEELCEIALPDYGYITNIGSAHLEGFGDMDGVYRGKTALFRYIDAHGRKCIVNQYDPYLVDSPISPDKAEHLQTALEVVNTEGMQLSVQLNGTTIDTQLTGAYNLDNINAAITVGLMFDVPMDQIAFALEHYQPTNKRSQIITNENHTLILDAYNANPSSMREALKNAISVTPSTQTSVAVIGDMYELGANSIEMHREILKYAISLGYRELVLVGKLMTVAVSELIDKQPDVQAVQISTYDTVDDLIPVWSQTDKSDTVYLIKASRGVKLERLITE